VEWRASFHFPREVLPAEGRAADIIVIGPRTVAEDAYHAFDAGTVLLSAGRTADVFASGHSGGTGGGSQTSDTAALVQALVGRLVESHRPLPEKTLNVGTGEAKPVINRREGLFEFQFPPQAN
jgi:hypothetical protein